MWMLAALWLLVGRGRIQILIGSHIKILRKSGLPPPPAKPNLLVGPLTNSVPPLPPAPPTLYSSWQVFEFVVLFLLSFSSCKPNSKIEVQFFSALLYPGETTHPKPDPPPPPKPVVFLFPGAPVKQPTPSHSTLTPSSQAAPAPR